MRILYLTPGVFDKGGIARYNRFQIRALKEKWGKENILVMSLAGRMYDDLEESIDVHFAGAMPVNNVSRALFSIAVLDTARKFRPDLVVSTHVHLGPLSWCVAKLCSAKFVQNIYGCELWPEGGLTKLRREALGKADLVISDCHSTADKAIEMGLLEKKAEVIWDCVDIEKYRPGKPEWPRLESYGLKDNGKFKILFLGRISKTSRYKGFERILHIASKLSNEFEIVVAGKGDYVETLKKLVANLGIKQRVVLTGSVHEDDMPDIYRSANVFYLVSEAGPGKGEGIPLTPLEAMGCGVPVLVGNQDGSRETLLNSGGWCGDPYDLDGQMKYLLQLRSNKDFALEESRNARKRCEDVFAYKSFSTNTVEILSNFGR